MKKKIHKTLVLAFENEATVQPMRFTAQFFHFYPTINPTWIIDYLHFHFLISLSIPFDQ